MVYLVCLIREIELPQQSLISTWVGINKMSKEERKLDEEIKTNETSVWHRFICMQIVSLEEKGYTYASFPVLTSTSPFILICLICTRLQAIVRKTITYSVVACSISKVKRFPALLMRAEKGLSNKISCKSHSDFCEV